MAERLTIMSVQEPDQINRVRALFREYRAFLGSCLCFQSFDAELAELPGEYKPPGGQLLLALLDSTPAGCVALRKLEPEICEMKRLYVRPEFRGQGVGRDLVLTLIEQARQLPYERMRLDTIATRMTEAISLYCSLGFREIAPYHGDPIPGAIHMELDLRQP
jgi:putative acetyltransferase